MKIVFATHNKNKFLEVKNALPEGIELLNLTDIECFEDIAETGTTLKENAAIKADYVFEHYNYPCFSDDTGLEVQALNGAPGVYSARFAGENATDADNRAKLLEDLVGEENRQACFKTVIALRLSATEIQYFEGLCCGDILEEERGGQGFGYDAIFQPENYDISFAEMDLAEKNRISHRGRAVKELMEYLESEV